MYVDEMYIFLILIGLLITGGAQAFITCMYRKYSDIGNTKKISGAEAARKVLSANGLKDIYVVETNDFLTDHYDPSRKVIRLSKEIYNGESISAVSVACHECGHAIQDKCGYSMMRMRSKLVPITNLSSKAGYIAIILGLFFSISDFIFIGIVCELVIVLFQLITLPVEFDASKRALKEINRLSLLDSSECVGGQKVLTAAALTYVAGVLTSILEVFRLAIIYANRRK